MKKRSLFERLSGAVPATDDFDAFDDEYVQPQVQRRPVMQQTQQQVVVPTYEEEPSAEGQLPVDVYQTSSEIIIRTFVAGVRPDELNVSISRDMVTIEGNRAAQQNVDSSDYFHQELFWGSFSRTILLPEEVDVDNSSAGSKDGLLTLVLPKLDKARQTKLRVKAG